MHAIVDIWMLDEIRRYVLPFLSLPLSSSASSLFLQFSSGHPAIKNRKNSRILHGWKRERLICVWGYSDGMMGCFSCCGSVDGSRRRSRQSLNKKEKNPLAFLVNTISFRSGTLPVMFHIILNNSIFVYFSIISS